MTQTKERFECVNLMGVPERRGLPDGFGYCGICDAWHDNRWHIASWRHKAYDENRPSVAVYRRVHENV